MKAEQRNIRRIQEQLGSGAVRQEPEPAKKRPKVGAREAEARAMRESQSLCQRQP